MSTDRELLELAAKAAGVPGYFIERSPEDGHPAYSCGIGLGISLWNPLTGDGDALRLAVKLKLDIQFFEGFGEIVVEQNAGRHPQAQEEYCDDMQAATRRAIVRAAAEIGRAMS